MLNSESDTNIGSFGPGGWEIGDITEFGANEIPAAYIPIYKEAAEKYGVPWNLLAAHHRVETTFSTLKVMISPVGAIGHFQFMEKTWLGWGWKGGTRLGKADIPEHILTDPKQIAKYGGYGTDGDGDGKADPWNLVDATHSAARYLAANGAADGDLRRAVFAYNHSEEYVNKVLGYANQYVNGFTAVQGGGSSGGQIIDGAAWPVPGYFTLTSRFGHRKDPFTGKIAYHDGLDIAGGGINGKPVVAAFKGKVSFAGVRGGYGNAVIIDHGNGLTSLYGHMSAITTQVGKQINPGDQVGKVGSTGRSTGPHLHFTMKQDGVLIDPEKYVGKFLKD
ncbi:MAG: peptidoglycan DD-metalloendopeptidase family protein, partial [Bacillus sp. (in: firmicutes)]